MNLQVCARCKKRPAMVFITRLEKDKSINEGLCLVCAQELGIKPVNDMLSRMELISQIAKHDDEFIKELLNKYCPAPSPNAPASAPAETKKSDGCYVATAVYGSYDCPQVWTLRRYRDYTLAETRKGRAFIKTYYAISPTLVKWFGHTKWFKRVWKKRLDKMVEKLQANGVENTPYEDKIW